MKRLEIRSVQCVVWEALQNTEYNATALPKEHSSDTKRGHLIDQM